MDTRPNPLVSTNNNHNHLDSGDEIKTLRRDIDAVRSNLSSELAELRQRREVVEHQLSDLMKKGMMLYSLFVGIGAIIALFRRRKQDNEYLKGVAVQVGAMLATQAIARYQTRQKAIEQSGAPKLRLITDRSRALQEWKEPEA